MLSFSYILYATFQTHQPSTTQSACILYYILAQNTGYLHGTCGAETKHKCMRRTNNTFKALYNERQTLHSTRARAMREYGFLDEISIARGTNIVRHSPKKSVYSMYVVRHGICYAIYPPRVSLLFIDMLRQPKGGCCWTIIDTCASVWMIWGNI